MTNRGDYYQVLFHDGLGDDDKPYFLIQRQFEFPDSDVRHFESHIENLTEHCKVESAVLTPGVLKKPMVKINITILRYHLPEMVPPLKILGVIKC